MTISPRFPAGQASPGPAAPFRESRSRRARVTSSLRAASRAPFVALGAALLLTIATTAVTWVVGTARDRARFENAVESTQDRVRARLGAYVTLLQGTRGLFAVSDTVTAREFRSYVRQLLLARDYPGVLGIGFSRRVTADSAGTERHSVIYLEPLDRRNQAAIGFDMYSEPTRREAMARARDTGRPALSGVVTLKQEIEHRKQRGFLVYLPVYREATAEPATVSERRARLLGFVYSPFRADDVFAGIFGTERQPRVTFRVFDGPPTADRLLHDSGHWPGDRGARPAFTRARVLETAGRRWTIVYSSLPFLDATSWTRLATPAVFAVGLVLSLGLFSLVRAQARARAAAEHSEAVRARFFASMSHELRTPLNAVLGYSGLLLDGLFGPLNERQADSAQRIQRSGRHLLELVNDVLDISKLEAGKLTVHVEEVDVPALLDDLLGTVRPMAESQQSPIEVDAAGCAVPVHTDPRRLRQILLNLLSNAAKFGAGRPIVVHCAATADDGLVVEVRDRGPGIAPADLPLVFEEFVQLPNSAQGGTGLGLPISRRLAELLGGRLEAESTVGVGSTFRLTLPGITSTRSPGPASRAGD